MEHHDGHLSLSASDLANHLGCRHLTQLSRQVAMGERAAPFLRPDPRLDALRERGFAHEDAYLKHLEAERGAFAQVVDKALAPGAGVARTRALLAAGAEVIVQAVLVADPWRGRADVLLKTDTPSALGNWSYEVVDTKLARETQGATILQLCLYAQLLEQLQGVLPERIGVVTPQSMTPQWYRTRDYLAYFRRVQAGLAGAVAVPVPTYPEPVALCDLCRWQVQCKGVRRSDDHLSLVAGILTSQRRELAEHDVHTVRALAQLPQPLTFRPSRGAVESYERIREQARVQVAGRDADAPVFELLELLPEHGFGRLPEPSAGDLYFDIEGDRYAGTAGLEYLLGVAWRGDGAWQYRSWWAFDAAQEKQALEAFVDFVEARRATYPDLHIYHFDHYEPSAIKRLMGRYATCEERVDDWLRHRLFVDLHQVLRQSLRASVERYGLKDMEAFYPFTRAVALREAGDARAVLERAIELLQLAGLREDITPTVEGYNRDDCLSTAALHDWLEGLRQQQIDAGIDIARPAAPVVEKSEKLTERIARIEDVVRKLTADVPVDEAERSAEQHARWLLAYCQDYYRREDKQVWWEKFRLMELDVADYVHENKALGGLEFVGQVPGPGKTPVHRYRFPAQECGIRGDTLLGPDGETVGTVHNLDVGNCWVDIKKTAKSATVHPRGVFDFSRFNASEFEGSLLRLADWVIDNGIDAPGPHRAARDLLLRRPPRLGAGIALTVAADTLVEDAQTICRGLDHSILPVQGPPGSGKTYLGAQLIVDLVRQGKRVGVCANSHKVIRNLLERVLMTADELGVAVGCAAKPLEKGDLAGTDIEETMSNPDALHAIANHANVLGGTKYLWARGEFANAVDVLVIDEASQVALADALAVSGAAASVVYLGDPMQLEQPQQGSHPPGIGVSPLDHLLCGERTLPAAQGIFIPTTRRLHPRLCEFTSEVFYEGKLRSKTGLERQALAGCGAFDGAGLHVVPVQHTGNQSASREEAEVVAGLVAQLLAGTWTNERGEVAPLTLEKILIVTPYNAQVAKLAARLPPDAHIGTVDKFQGQEAPVVIYSMATSSAEDAPRGMEFLYSANRFNVATSRARCAVILVASPLLFEVECRTPAQMKLANAVCLFGEVAKGHGLR